MLAIIGLMSGIIYIIGDIPYIRDIIRGKTKPHRVSWLIFLILNIIFLINQIALNATNSLWIIVAWIIVTLLVFLLSIKKGVGGFTKLDILCLFGVVVGLILWNIFDNPILSLMCNAIVSILAFIPTLIKTYIHPHTETSISWFTASLSSLLAAISVGTLDYKLLLPSISFVACFTIFALSMQKKSNI